MEANQQGMYNMVLQLYNVQPQTHNKTDSVPLDISLKACLYKFANKTICHKNKVISYVMKNAVSNHWSVVGWNYRNMYGKENVLNDSWNESITQDETCEIGNQLCHVFTKDEVNMFIELLSVK